MFLDILTDVTGVMPVENDPSMPIRHLEPDSQIAPTTDIES